MSGVPGLSDLPLLGRLFANNSREAQQTDIILMLTPRIIRVLDLNEVPICRPFRVGRDVGGAVLDLPFSRRRRRPRSSRRAPCRIRRKAGVAAAAAADPGQPGAVTPPAQPTPGAGAAAHAHAARRRPHLGR